MYFYDYQKENEDEILTLNRKIHLKLRITTNLRFEHAEHCVTFTRPVALQPGDLFSYNFKEHLF